MARQKGERTDILRRRPRRMRYFYLAVSKTNIHTGMSYGGLAYIQKTRGIEALYLADLLNMTVVEVKEPYDNFMRRWRLGYNQPGWDYSKEIELEIPAPKEVK